MAGGRVWTAALLVLLVGTAAPAAGEEPARNSTLVVYGNDKCPESSEDEVVVCARRPENERYRVPKELREKERLPGGIAWGQQVSQMEEATRFHQAQQLLDGRLGRPDRLFRPVGQAVAGRPRAEAIPGSLDTLIPARRRPIGASWDSAASSHPTPFTLPRDGGILHRFLWRGAGSMIALVVALGMSGAGMQGNANSTVLPRKNLGMCLNKVVEQKISDKLGADAFKAAAKEACAKEASSFRAAWVSYEVSMKTKRADAEQNADSQIDDYVANAVDTYEESLPKT